MFPALRTVRLCLGTFLGRRLWVVFSCAVICPHFLLSSGVRRAGCWQAELSGAFQLQGTGICCTAGASSVCLQAMGQGPPACWCSQVCQNTAERQQGSSHGWGQLTAAGKLSCFVWVLCVGDGAVQGGILGLEDEISGLKAFVLPPQYASFVGSCSYCSSLLVASLQKLRGHLLQHLLQQRTGAALVP